MDKYAAGLLIFLFVSCAGYKEIKPDSQEFHSLKRGNIVWVYTGVVDRERLIFKAIEGDSLFTETQSFHIDSITRIQKESYSKSNSWFLSGSVITIVGGTAIVIMVAALTIYIKLVSVFI